MNPIRIFSVILIAGLFGCATPSREPESTTHSGNFRDLTELLDTIFSELREKDVLSSEGNRIAVYSEDAGSAQSEFMNFLIDKIQVRLPRSDERIRIFEREQLTLLLTEQKLTLSGMTAEEGAQAIGKISSIDMLLIPVYTKLGTSVDITIRLVSSTTGRLVFSSGYMLDISNDLAGLFTTERAGTQGTDVQPSLHLYSISDNHSYYHQRIVAAFDGKQGLQVSSTKMLGPDAFIESSEYRGDGIVFLISDEVHPSRVYTEFLGMERTEFNSAAGEVFFRDVVVEGRRTIVLAGPSREAVTDALFTDKELSRAVFDLLVGVFSP